MQTFGYNICTYIEREWFILQSIGHKMIDL